LLTVAAVAGTLLLAEGWMRVLDLRERHQSSFCAWCRQAAHAASQPAAGAHGLAPPMPSGTSGLPQPFVHLPQEVDYSLKFPAGYILFDRPYVSLSPSKEGHRSIARTQTGQTVYDVRYRIDPFRRRVVPDQGEDGRKRFLVLLGCSWTFGEGLEDDETLPYRVSREAGSFRVYNYSMHGYGPGDLLLRLRSTPIADELTERRGRAAYVYIDAHLDRVIGPMSLVSTWGSRKPYFDETADGELRWLGDFESGRKWTTVLYRWLWGSSLVQNFGIEFPPWVQERTLRLFARLVDEMRHELRSATELEDFHVVFLPGTRTARMLIPYLEERGIRYVNYDRWDLGLLTKEQLYITYDAHPTAAYHRAFAKHLARDLGVSER
jgi:hypothetical protein